MDLRKELIVVDDASTDGARAYIERAMRFLLKSIGFEGVKLKFSAPAESSMRTPSLSDTGGRGTTLEEFNRGIERLNDLLYGPQDYAVIGKKSQSH